jgi:hypothetical protein
MEPTLLFPHETKRTRRAQADRKIKELKYFFILLQNPPFFAVCQHASGAAKGGRCLFVKMGIYCLCMDKIILKAAELDGYLTEADKEDLKNIDLLFDKALGIFPKLQNGTKAEEDELVRVYNEIGSKIHEIFQKNPGIHFF